MSPRPESTRTAPPTGARTAHATQSRVDAQFATGTQGLTNVRARIVGDRTGVLADAIVAVVRATKAAQLVLARVTARVAAVVTPLGWAITALGPVALLAGYLLGWIELVIIGYAAVALLTLAALFLIGRTPARVELDVTPGRVVVGEPAVGRVIAHNSRRRAMLGSRVEIPVGTGLVEVALPALRGGARHAHEFAIPTVQRGLFPIGPVRAVRADPVGLVRREFALAQAEQLRVHPRTISVPSMSTGLIRDLEGNPTRDLSTSDVSFHALREYAPGDDRRYIHWRSTARTGTYMVRQFEETRRSHLVIALGLAAAEYASDEEFELAVSVTGSLAARAIRDTRSVSVVVSATTPDFAKRKVFAVTPISTLTRTRLLDGLTVVDRADAALSTIDVARVVGAGAAGVSVAFLVCGSAVTAADLRAASIQFPLGVEVVAVVCNPDATPALRRVSGLTVLTIGFLDDLQKSLARAAV